MKKLFIIALAASFCLAFAMPAMAKVTVGGLVTIGYAYNDTDGEKIDGGRSAGQVPVSNGEERTTFSLIRPLTQITVKYASDDNNVRGFTQIRGSDNGQSDTAAGELFVWNYAWIDWQITPNFYLRFGRQTQAAMIMGPGFITGSDATMTWFGFGNAHGASSKDGVRAYIKFNDMIRMEIAAYNPDDMNAEAGLTGNEESVLPRFDIAIPIDIAGWHFEPSALWQTQGWIGENLGNGAGPSVGTPFSDPNTVRSAMAYVETGTGLNRMSDAELWGFWVEAGIKFGPARLMLVYGLQDMENDVNPTTAADDHDWKAQMYGVYMPISVAKGFEIRPEVLIADFDNSALDGGGIGITSDYGDMLQVGVMFKLAF
ncbi:MAG: porin [Deltaproteobacteria bacterium]|nr:porin [Deltaproteobacteria bacterium]